MRNQLLLLREFCRPKSRMGWQLSQPQFNRSKTLLSKQEIIKHSEGADVLVATIKDNLDCSVIVKLLPPILVLGLVVLTAPA